MKRKVKKKGRLKAVLLFVPEARLELACPYGRHPLKMVCLPVPPFGQMNVSVGGLEPPTLCLKGRCSTPELHARTFSTHSEDFRDRNRFIQQLQYTKQSTKIQCEFSERCSRC